MRHTKCGGIIVESPDMFYTYTYEIDRNFGIEYIPALFCTQCGEEIIGDDEIVIEGLSDVA